VATKTILRAVVEVSGLSRRKAFAAIRESRVAVEGKWIADPSAPYAGGVISLDGYKLTQKAHKKIYLLLNKPPDYITTVSDELGRRTVMGLVPQSLHAPSLHPVGRLDRDTSGLLLLTNDGDLTYALTHPKHEVEKEYWVRLRTQPSTEQLDTLLKGVEIDGQIRRPLRLRRLVGESFFQFSITIREGRNRQVKRMFEAVGGRVTALRRVREGSLTLGNLPEGQVRQITASEVSDLRGDSS
jgi:23S rRNA pseudouridine2605 synthase